MKLSFESQSYETLSADLLAVFIHSDKSLLEKRTRDLSKTLGSVVLPPFTTGDFRGRTGETTHVYLDRPTGPKRLLLVGLGPQKEMTLEQFRRAGAAAAKAGRKHKSRNVVFLLPAVTRDAEASIRALFEGALLALYRFNKYQKSTPADEPDPDSLIACSSEKALAPKARKALSEAGILAESTITARNLANAPGNEIYPQTLAEYTKELGRRLKFSVIVFDENEIKKLAMGGILGVAQGSVRPPRFIILEYGKNPAKPIVLVGKGVTFDSGGISIKPSANMAEMKMDMSGAAAVIGAFEAVARLKLPVHIIGLIPTVENMPSGSALRPGDILRHMNGKTSEVDNTDAEGRLILADALSYADRYKPSAVIDLATLTGACVVALGHHATGMMGNNSQLMSQLKQAGEQCYERVWELPLFDEYEKLIKSDVADVKNVGGRWAGAITAALFLKRFIGDYRWVHLDIAGTAILEEHSEYHQKGASGVGVRLLVEYLRHAR